MGKKSKIFIGVLVVLVVIAIAIALYFSFCNNTEEATFKLDSENKYKIQTTMKWLTMQNDGGSHTDVYYNLDFDANLITKVSETYKANLGGESETTINELYTKTLDEETKNELKTLLVDLIEKEDDNEEGNFVFVVIYNLENKKTIYNVDSIERINTILEKIDNM